MDLKSQTCLDVQYNSIKISVGYLMDFEKFLTVYLKIILTVYLTKGLSSVR